MHKVPFATEISPRRLKRASGVGGGGRTEAAGQINGNANHYGTRFDGTRRARERAGYVSP